MKRINMHYKAKSPNTEEPSELDEDAEIHERDAAFHDALADSISPNVRIGNDAPSELERLRGIIARNARTRLDENGLYVTAKDISDSLEILYAEMEREGADSSNGQAQRADEAKSRVEPSR